MRAAESGVHPREAELDVFLELAAQELKTAVGAISAYTALLDAQLACDPGMSALREIVREVRDQAHRVAALADEALDATHL
jgi:signal transduction histidine kinase